MPKQKRWLIKRQLTQSIGKLDSAMDEILKVAHPFEHVHDDLFDMLLKIVGSIYLTTEAIKRFRDDL